MSPRNGGAGDGSFTRLNATPTTIRLQTPSPSRRVKGMRMRSCVAFRTFVVCCWPLVRQVRITRRLTFGSRIVNSIAFHFDFHNPTTWLQGDAAITRLAIDEQTGPVVLVGHSYGGAVITEAGTHPKVERLVYITAFAPDKGESVNTLIANPPPGSADPPAKRRLPFPR